MYIFVDDLTLRISIFFLAAIDKALYFANKGEDFVKLMGMRSLTAFTVCMWMSSSDNEGSPFSYAVSGQDDELLIYYKRYFQLFIGGEKRLDIQYCAKVMQKKFDGNEWNFVSNDLWFPLMWNFTWLHETFVRYGSSEVPTTFYS